jgi:hypothetical protein
MKIRGGVRAAAVLIGGTMIAGGSLAAAPAFAEVDPVYVGTDTTYWSVSTDLDDDEGLESDDQGFYYAGGFDGWADEAFDSLGETTVTYCDEQGVIGLAGELTFNSAESTGTEETATVVYDWSWAAGDCDPLQAKVTIDFEGNFAKWTIAFDDAVESANFHIDAAADEEIGWRGPNYGSIVGYDKSKVGAAFALYYRANGPVDSFSGGEPGVDTADFLAYDTTEVTVIAAVADHSWDTGNAAASDFLASIGYTLVDFYGASFAPFYGTDGPQFPVKTLTTGAAVDEDLAYEYMTMVDPDAEDPVDYFLSADDDEYVDYEILAETLPAGLELAISFDATTGRPVVHVSGTPTEAGTYAVPVVFYIADLTGEDKRLPLVSLVQLTVEDPAAPAAGPTKALAETGFDGSPLGLAAAALMVLGLGAMGLRRTRRGAAQG